MNTPSKIFIISALLALLGVGVWYGVVVRAINSNGVARISNVNQEGYWDAYWADLVIKAEGQKQPVIIGEFTFWVPSSLIRGDSGSITYFAFVANQTEGPTIHFEEVDQAPDEIISSFKSNLSPFEKVVAEKTETINGTNWTMVRRTTDFGIDEVVWVAKRTKTMEVFYQVFPPGPTTVFENIVRSAKPS